MNIKPRSRLGYVVGSEMELSFELTNIDSRPFTGGLLTIIMTPANGVVVTFGYQVKALKPNEKTVIDKDSRGNPIITKILAPGFNYFAAQMEKVAIYSPPTEYRGNSFFDSILSKSKEEIYTLVGLIIAAVGLFLTAVLGIIQLLH